MAEVRTSVLERKNVTRLIMGRRKKEEGRRKKEEGRRKKEEGSVQLTLKLNKHHRLEVVSQQLIRLLSSRTIGNNKAQKKA